MFESQLNKNLTNSLTMFLINFRIMSSLTSGYQLIYNFICIENDLSKCRLAKSTFGWKHSILFSIGN